VTVLGAAHTLVPARTSNGKPVIESAIIRPLAEAISEVGRAEFEAKLAAFLRTASGYQSMVFIAYFITGVPRPLYSTLSAYDEERTLTPYFSGAYLLDPYYNMVLDGTPDGIYKLTDCAPDDFHNSEYYKTYYANIDLNDECGILVRLSSEACLILSLGVRAGDGSVARTLSSVEALFPCLSALCLSHWGELSGLHPTREASLDDLCRQRGLSGREVEVTALLLRGYSSKLIARELSISPETVKVYRKRVNRKLGTSSAREIFATFFDVSATSAVSAWPRPALTEPTRP